MLKRSIQISALGFLVCCAQLNSKNLSTEMTRLNVNTALIVNSQAIDDYPLWSPNSDFVAANIEGKWYKFRLKNINLEEAEWHQNKIGVLISNNGASILKERELKEFGKKVNSNGRRVTAAGVEIELKLNGFSTSMGVTKNNNKKILWTSGIENCHSLSLSPNEEYVAYLCELSGLFVMRIE